jgi:hypothetical protein
MKRIFEQLSSMQFTTVILAVLMLWFACGILLAESDAFCQGFKVMNSYLTPAWFSQPGRLSFLLKLWFAGLCLVMAILGINLIFCSWTKILKIMHNRQTASRLVMLIIHIVFGLVALGHFASFFLGYRYENIKLQEGQSLTLPEGYAVTVRNIHFVDDVTLPYQRPKKGGPGAFHPEANFCEVALTRNGAAVSEGKACSLTPFAWKGMQVTLNRFTPPKAMKNRDNTEREPGVRLIISRNPVKPFVFILFPVMIAGIGVYTVMTWRTRPPNNLGALSQLE